MNQVITIDERLEESLEMDGVCVDCFNDATELWNVKYGVMEMCSDCEPDTAYAFKIGEYDNYVTLL